MNPANNPEAQVFIAARNQGVSSVLFRRAISRRLGLSATDSECLTLLSIKGVCTPKELARYTGLTTGSTTAMLDRLEKVGYITRKPNPTDRRGVLVEINEKYTELAKPLVAGIQQAHRELIAKYSEDELRVIADFLDKFTQNITEATEQIEKSL